MKDKSTFYLVIISIGDLQDAYKLYKDRDSAVAGAKAIMAAMDSGNGEYWSKNYSDSCEKACKDIEEEGFCTLPGIVYESGEYYDITISIEELELN